MNRLEGKTAVVTGGTSGIGQKIVELFCAQGARVVFTGRNKKRGESVAKATSAIFFQTEAEDENQAEKIVTHAREVHKHLDILINNAGSVDGRSSVIDVTAQQIDKAVALHLRAPWLLIAKAAPIMRENGGSIVNMSSVAAHRVGAVSLTYSVAKAALIHLTRAAAAELGKHNIRVNSISPGFIATPIHAATLGFEGERADMLMSGMERFFTNHQSLRRVGQAGDVASAALYLASDEASFVTGTDLIIDGGLMWGQFGV